MTFSHIQKKTIKALWLLALFALPMYSWANLTAQVNKTQLSLEETLTLTLSLDGTRANREPDFSLLETQFDILSMHPSYRRTIINGRESNESEWTLLLAPKRSGKLLIPSFSLMGFISDAIEVEILKDSANKQGQQLRKVFMETLANKNDVYVQEQTIVSFRLNFSQSIENVSTDPFAVTGALIEDIQDTNGRRNIGGAIYEYVDFNYAIFPQESGELVIPEKIWQLRVRTSAAPGSFFSSGRYETLRVRTPELRINVKPIPAAFPQDKVWLPAKSLNIAELWSEDLKNFTLGEPVTPHH